MMDRGLIDFAASFLATGVQNAMADFSKLTAVLQEIVTNFGAVLDENATIRTELTALQKSDTDAQASLDALAQQLSDLNARAVQTRSPPA